MLVIIVIIVTVVIVTVAVVIVLVIIVTVVIATVVVIVTFVVATRADVTLLVIPVKVPAMVVNTNYATFDICRRIEIFNSPINIITTSITSVTF